jgi:hypothetical protein
MSETIEVGGGPPADEPESREKPALEKGLMFFGKKKGDDPKIVPQKFRGFR